jgi:hypothetical protein
MSTQSGRTLAAENTPVCIVATAHASNLMESTDGQLGCATIGAEDLAAKVPLSLKLLMGTW